MTPYVLWILCQGHHLFKMTRLLTIEYPVAFKLEIVLALKDQGNQKRIAALGACCGRLLCCGSVVRDHETLLGDHLRKPVLQNGFLNTGGATRMERICTTCKPDSGRYAIVLQAFPSRNLLDFFQYQCSTSLETQDAGRSGISRVRRVRTVQSGQLVGLTSIPLAVKSVPEFFPATFHPHGDPPCASCILMPCFRF